MDVNDTTALCVNNQKIDMTTKTNTVSRIIKRLIDIIVGLMGTIVLIPLSLIIKIVNIIYKDKETIFFIQERIGKNGKTFKMYKFRTMIMGAEDELERIMEENEELRKEYEKNKKLQNDPRITKVGKFLRKTSLDEFPQFINILKGEMTVVGPRPYLKREIKEMRDAYSKIITMKPGLTGLWQISGRSDLDFNNRVKLDEEYYRNNTLLGDFKIFLKTISIVIFRKGAV